MILPQLLHGGTNFNPRSSCEERQGQGHPAFSRLISIHAPHARSDLTSVTISL